LDTWADTICAVSPSTVIFAGCSAIVIPFDADDFPYIT
jgi:hypothetical protein